MTSASDYVTLNLTTLTAEGDNRGVSWIRILAFTGSTVAVVVTFVGNVIVILAFVIEKKLRNTFSIYILNLAITDVSVAVTAMSFYTLDILLGWWPFGLTGSQIICGVWIFFDYGMTFASVFTLVAISIDRVWSVTWSFHYRGHNTMRKTKFSLFVIWTSVLVIWLVPCIMDRLRNAGANPPWICIWEPSRNRAFVVLIAIVGHHGPDIVMIACYLFILRGMRKRARQLKIMGGSISKDANTTVVEVETKEFSKTAVAPVNDDGEEIEDQTTMTTVEGDQARLEKGRRIEEQRYQKERKAFITLTYIIFSYLLCWLPFHFVFDISAISADLVPTPVYMFTFWLTYFNSTLNPLIYAYSNRELKEVFRKVIRCQFG